MKKIIILIVLIFSLIISCFTQSLTSNFSYSVLYNKESGSYLETYMSVIGKTAVFKLNENNKLQSSIEVSMIFKQNGEVVTFNKYNLMSPEIDSKDSIFPNYIDLQRIKLPNGLYNFELSVKDLYASGEKFNHFDIIQVNVPDSEISVSDILFVESYKPTGESNMLSKNGYDMVPYIANFYPDNMKTLTFYTEIYNPGKEVQASGSYIVKYYIENSNNKQILHDYSKFKKLNQGDLNCVFTEFNIESLASGNYSLVVEVRDKENRMLCKKDRFFQRSAPGLEIAENKIKPVSFDSSFVKSFISKDTLKEYINCLKPIADINEKQYIENQVKAGDLALMQQFFYDFWTKRNPGNPENDWQIYHEQVKMVNNLYSTKIYKGYETDRGRVYLAYGAPNNVVEAKHEPSAYPYEIWHYYQSNTPYGEQVNIKFVFYNPELIGDYTLLHSTAKGEFSDPQWERRLSKRNNTMYNHDVKDSDEAIGNRAKENFNK